MRRRFPPGGSALRWSCELVVRHCLEKKREARFQSARDLAFVLEFLVQGGRVWREVLRHVQHASDLRASIASLF